MSGSILDGYRLFRGRLRPLEACYVDCISVQCNVLIWTILILTICLIDQGTLQIVQVQKENSFFRQLVAGRERFDRRYLVE